jgi:hypothetical protein
MAISVLLFFPETKGKSLEEMDNLFGTVEKHHKPKNLGGEVEAV